MDNTTPDTTFNGAVLTSARDYRKKRQAGHLWTAPSGSTFLVRDIDLSDHATISQFPDNLRRLIYDALDRSTKLAQRGPSDEDLTVDLFGSMKGEDILRSEYEIGLNLCRVGWIHPRVVDVITNEDEEITPDDILSADRRAYMTHVMGGYTQEAGALAPFPERPMGSVGTGPTVSAVSPDAEPAVETVGAGILRSDGV